MAMVEPIFDAMGEVLTRWTMGSAAASAAPMWKSALGAEPAEAELRLLALSSQFLGVAVTAAAPPRLHILPDIPALALPTVPAAVRPLIRRVLDASKERWMKVQLLRFLAARGWTVHPGDWMPAANDDEVPELYAPWRIWAEQSDSADGSARAAADPISADTWDEYLPVARRIALAQLRQRDPAAARALLEAKIAGENAEARLKLLGLLEMGLSESDAPFLESVAVGDRAATVKALAASLLDRLRRGLPSDEDVAELRRFFPVQAKGLLRRSRVIRVETLKSPAQLQRRAELLKAVDIQSFAEALGVTGPELIAIWPWGVDRGADCHLIIMVGHTGADSLVLQTAEVVCRNGGDAMGYVSYLLPRLAAGERSALAKMALNRPDCSFGEARGIGGGALRLDNPLDTHAGAALLASFAGDGGGYLQAEALRALGLVTARAWARPVLERLNAAGLLYGDPRLDMLRLNEALDDNGAKS